MIHAAIDRYRLNYSYQQTLAKACSISTTPINTIAAAILLLHPRKRHFAPAVSCPAAHLIGSACKTHKHDWLSHTHLHRSSTPALSPTCPLRSPSSHHPQHSFATADHQGRLLQALPHAPPLPRASAPRPSRPDLRLHRCEVGTIYLGEARMPFW